MADNDHRGDDASLAHIRRQKKAIQKYIKEITGMDLGQVPKEVQNRLALQWINKYASRYRYCIGSAEEKPRNEPAPPNRRPGGNSKLD